MHHFTRLQFFLLVTLAVFYGLLDRVTADCTSSQTVSSEADLATAVICAQNGNTNEILINSNIEISETIEVIHVTNLTIKGITATAGLEYSIESQRRRLIQIMNSSITFEYLMFLGDPVAGCFEISNSHADMRGVQIQSLPNTFVLIRNNGLGMYLLNSTVIMEDSVVSGWKSANQGSGVFLEIGSDLTMSRTTFMDNAALLSGGGAYISNGCTLSILDNSRFVSNSALRSGGAVNMLSSSLNVLWINDTTFVNNSAMNGGALSVETSIIEGGRDIYTFNINNVSFYRNSAGSQGGGLQLLAGGILNNVTCDSNSAGEAGGGFLVSGDRYVTATGLVIIDNMCLNPNEDVVVKGGGGSVQNNAFFKCEGCIFEGNTAVNGGGGGLMVLNRRSVVVLDSSQFVRNVAGFGGAVAEENSNGSVVTDCKFYGNSAVTTGGAVHSFHNPLVLLSSCKFVNNTCTSDLSQGGTLYLREGKLSIYDSFISGGNAGFGGGVYTEGVEVNIERSVLSGCTALRQGGAIEVTSFSSLSFKLSTISRCVAGQSGGGIYVSSSSTVDVMKSRFENLTSGASGGVIYLEYRSKLTSASSTYLYNMAVDGGAMFLDHESESYVWNSLFEGNIALNGGVAALRSSELFSQNNTFRNNDARIGGVLSIGTESIATCEDDIFLGNNAADSGGVMLIDQASFANLTRCLFKDSYANYGGALKCASNAVFLIHDSIFDNNEAEFAGGAINIESSDHSDLINCTFIGSKSQRGGALVLGNAELGITGSKFTSSLSLYGGCIYAEDFSTVLVESSDFTDSFSLLGGIMFIVMSEANFTECFFGNNNGADADTLSGFNTKFIAFTQEASSGGVFTATLAHITMFKCISVSNSAHSGGVMQLRYSSVISTDSIYFNNSAYTGGLVHINARSYVSFNRDRCQRNIAVNQGALVFGVNFGVLIFDNVTIDASNSFSDFHSTLVFLNEGRFDLLSSFLGNPLNTTRSTTLDMKGLILNIRDSEFRNFYGSGVGAIVRVLEGVETNIHNCIFLNNVADLYGGAVAFSSSKNVSISNCAFHGNTAKISGGAIFSQDSTLTVTNSIFRSNRAYLGGGCLYWTRSDITYENNDDYQNYALYGPVLASTAKALFINNSEAFLEPQTSGQKLSTPVQVVMHDYYGQTVRTGGYATLTQIESYVITASTTDKASSISGSTIEVFEHEIGVALFNDLTTTLQPGGSLVLNFDAQGEGGIASVEMNITLRKCVQGEIVRQVSVNQYTCEMCPRGSYSFNPADVTCTPCPHDATCAGGDKLSPDKGFWRQCETCELIEECIFPDNCLGGANVSTQCASGNTGPICNVCESGYSRNTLGGCDKCGSIGVVVRLVFGLTFAFIIVLFVLAYIFRKIIIKKLGTYFHTFEQKLDRMNWNKHRTKVKIIIAFIQITAGIPALLSVEFHYDFNFFLDFLGYFTLGFFTAIDFGCFFSYNFYIALRVSTLIPPCFMLIIDAFLRLKSFIAVRSNSASPSYSYKVRNVDRKRFFLYISFFVFSTISTQIFQTFVCEEFEDGKSYLVVDSNLECYTQEHKNNMAYAGVMIFFYPVGIPLYYAFHLYRKKKYINPKSAKVVRADERHIISDDIIQQEKIKLRKTYKVLDGQQFLFDSYLPKCWYFEIVECFRRLSLTALPILFLRSSVVQIVLVLLISLGFSALYMSLHPYEQPSDNTVAILSQWAVSMTVVGALCMKVNSTSENGDEFEKEVVAILLIIVNAMIFVFTIYASAQETDFTDDMGDMDIMRESTIVGKSRSSAFVDSDDEEGRESKSQVFANVKNMTSLEAFDKGVSWNKKIEEEKAAAELMGEQIKEEERRKEERKRRRSKHSMHQENDKNGISNPLHNTGRRQSSILTPPQQSGVDSSPMRHKSSYGTSNLSSSGSSKATVIGFEMSSTTSNSRAKDSDDEDDA